MRLRSNFLGLHFDNCQLERSEMLNKQRLSGQIVFVEQIPLPFGMLFVNICNSVGYARTNTEHRSRRGRHSEHFQRRNGFSPEHFQKKAPTAELAAAL